MTATLYNWFPLIKGRILAVVLTVGALAFAQTSSADIAVGASTNDVIAELGMPRGYMAIGKTDVFIYDRGTVSFQKGRVVSTALQSPSETAQKKALNEARDKAYEQAHAEAAAKEQLDASAITAKPQDAVSPQNTTTRQKTPEEIKAEALNAKIVDIAKQITDAENTRYAPNRTSSRAQRRQARRDIDRLMPEFTDLRSQYQQLTGHDLETNALPVIYTFPSEEETETTENEQGSSETNTVPPPANQPSH